MTNAVRHFDTEPIGGLIYRFAEAQHRVSTMKLVDDLDEQKTLEELLDDTKPPVPKECAHLHYLLFTPFRYIARTPSRFRAKGDHRGVFYAAENTGTAAAETAFHTLRFYIESPETPFPVGPTEKTCFTVKYNASDRLDLTLSPYAGRSDLVDPVDYGATVEIAEQARKAGVDAIRYRSARRCGGVNLAILACSGFIEANPQNQETWRYWIKDDRIVARQDAVGGASFEYLHTGFSKDPRVGDWLSSRRTS